MPHFYGCFDVWRQKQGRDSFVLGQVKYKWIDLLPLTYLCLSYLRDQSNRFFMNDDIGCTA